MSPEVPRSGRRLRVTSSLPEARPDTADTAPQLDAIQGVLEVGRDTARSIWRVAGKIGLVIGAIGVIGGAAIGIGKVVASNERSEKEQAVVVREVRYLVERVSRMEGMLEGLARAQGLPIPPARVRPSEIEEEP